MYVNNNMRMIASHNMKFNLYIKFVSGILLGLLFIYFYNDYLNFKK